MVKKIGLSCILISAMAGLYGCSCSQQPTTNSNEPGLYISNVTVNEGDANASINVTLQRDNQDKVTVDYEVIGIANSGISDLATPEVDFKPIPGSLTFDPAGNDTQSIPLTIVDDSLYEHNESFLVKLVNASGASIVGTGIGIVTIQDNDPKPTISLTPIDVNQATSVNEDVGQIPMQISLNTASGVDAQVALAYSEETSGDSSTSGTIAAYRVDYLITDANDNLLTNNIFTIPAGQTSLKINVDIIDDGIVENTENFSLSLNKPVDATVSGSAQAFSILDNDAVAAGVQLKIPLNDTGMVEADTFDPTAVSSTIFTDQDVLQAMDYYLGRDAQANGLIPPALTKTGAGVAGFDFTKLDKDGKQTTAVAVQGQPLPWNCVQDNNTGLVWEVKTNTDIGLRSFSRNFYWFDPDYATNGSVAGKLGSFSCDANAYSYCNTAYYIADVNKQKLCGLSGWRLPTMSELRSIVNYNINSNPNATSNTIGYDTNYFSGDTTGTMYYWTSSTYVPDPSKAWTIKFGLGVQEVPRSKADYGINAIRLVNDYKIKHP